jgi:hypothetical protein
MLTIIFLCNELDWSKTKKVIEEVKSNLIVGKVYHGFWNCADIQNIQVGDKAYFKKVGKKPLGFFASGRIISAVSQLKSENPNYRTVSSAYDNNLTNNQFSVAVEWSSVVDTDQLLDIKKLQEKPEFKGANFKYQKSGCTFDSNYVKWLDHYWGEHCYNLTQVQKAAFARDPRSTAPVNNAVNRPRNETKILVPEEVYQGLAQIKSHKAINNMSDSIAVIRHARQIGLNQVAAWIESNPRNYLIGTVNGFELTS